MRLKIGSSFLYDGPHFLFYWRNHMISFFCEAKVAKRNNIARNFMRFTRLD